MNEHFVGIDGGGTGSRLMVISPNGETQTFESGPLNWATTPRALFLQNIQSLLNHLQGKQIKIAACLAGVLSEADRVDILKVVHESCPNAVGIVRPDFWASWKACNNPNAISVISGTGSLVCSVISGEMVKSGGGGLLLGDVGSGAFFGKLLVSKRVSRESIPESAEAIMNVFFETPDINQMVKQIYNSASAASLLGNLASQVLSATGAEMSTIVDEAMAPLAEIVRKHAHFCGTTSLEGCVYRGGGFWKSSPLIAEAFDYHLGVNSVEPSLSSLEGALNLAKEL